MLRKLLFLTCVTGLFYLAGVSVPSAMAQTGSLTGTVTNQNGQPLIGANVFLSEAKRGSTTNLNGKYTISDLPAGEYTLRVTFIGYKSFNGVVTIKAGQTTEKNITLSRKTATLNQLIVTGFGTEIQKADITTSVSSVEMKKITDVPVSNPSELLYGRVSGVQISSASGQPGAGYRIRIRGAFSFNAGARPLWVVDGVKMSFQEQSGQGPTFPIDFINPENIASFKILKGPAATAIYGAQGANGVVVVTTKTGQPGNTQITASVSRGFSTPILPLDLMNTQQWVKYFTTALHNVAGFTKSKALNFLRANVFQKYGGYPANVKVGSLRYTNWQDFIFKHGTTQKYNLTISGGNQKSRFYISGGYNQNKGIIKQTGITGYRLRTRYQHQISDKFTFGLNMMLYNKVQNFTCEDGFFVNCPIAQSVLELPFTYPYNADGTYSTTTRFGLSGNAAMIFNEQVLKTNVFHMVGSAIANYDFTKWLSLKAQFALDFRQIHDHSYRSPVYMPQVGGQTSTHAARISNIDAHATLNFNKTFNDKHNVNGFLGIEIQRNYSNEFNAFGKGLPGSLLKVLGSTSNPASVGGDNDEARRLGYFAKIKYNYDNRYFVSFTGRYDGSSRFGQDNRYGFFPAVSAGWRISNEDFFNSGVIDNLVLRAGYGHTGNSLIDFYAARGLYSVSGTYAGVVGFNPSQLANPLLTWEDKTTAQVGIDYSLFNRRLSGHINVYRSVRSAMLLGKPLPSTSSYGSILKNIGKVRTRGIEFKINTINVRNNDFIWATNFNITWYGDELKDLTTGVDVLNPSSSLPRKIGHSVLELKSIRWAGVNPVDGRPMWYTKDGVLTYNPTFADDAVLTGMKGQPSVVGGIGTSISYKGLSLVAQFNYDYGQYRLPQAVFFFDQAQIGVSLTNGRVAALTKAWKHPGDLVGIPKPWAFTGTSNYPGTTLYSRGSTNAFWSADYIRLKTATLSYSLPNSITSALHLQRIKLYISGYNLLTWTSYPGYDPEGTGPFPAASYPVDRRFVGGINVTF